MPTQGSSERLSLFFCRKQSTGLFLTAGQYLACPGRQETPTHRPKLRLGSFLLPKTVHRTVFNGRTIPGLPRKAGKANTQALRLLPERLRLSKNLSLRTSPQTGVEISSTKYFVLSSFSKNSVLFWGTDSRGRFSFSE